MKRHLKKGYALPGSSRAARLREEDWQRSMLPARIRAAAQRAALRRFDITGRKLVFDPRTAFEGKATKTPYGAKLLRRRRAADKIARKSRQINQGVRRAA